MIYRFKYHTRGRMYPRVTIIVLIYMVEEYLDKCISSVINQTYDNIEIILSVKKGKDNSFDICAEYKNIDSRIKIVDRKGNTRGEGRNEGMAEATGDYILFVDGDDWMELTMIERMVDSIKKYNSDVVICGDIYEYEEEPEKSVVRVADLPELIDKKELYREFLSRNSFGVEVWNKMYRFDRIRNVMFGNEQAEDRFWSAKVFELMDTISYVSSPEFHYVIRGDSGSRKPHVMESSLEGDCIMINNIRSHGYLEYEASYYLFNSCYSALYEAVYFGYFKYLEFNDTFIRMKGVSGDVIRYVGARRNDKIKAIFTIMGFHPLIWLIKASIRFKPAGIFDPVEET